MRLTNFIPCFPLDFTSQEIETLINDIVKYGNFGLCQYRNYKKHYICKDKKIIMHFNFDIAVSFFFGNEKNSRIYEVKKLKSFFIKIGKVYGLDTDTNTEKTAYFIRVITNAIKTNLQTNKKELFALNYTFDTDFVEGLKWLSNYGYPKE